MKHILIIQQWISAHQMYIEKWSTVLSGNEVIYPNELYSNQYSVPSQFVYPHQYGAANRLLTNANVGFYLTEGVTFPDGWSYYKSAAVPVVADPDVDLPVNVEAEPPTLAVPGDYEIRCKIVKQF